VFHIGDRIAHPLHGAGTISEIEEKRIDGRTICYYVMHAPKGDMRIMIPTESCDKIGIRPVVSKARARAILREIPALPAEENANWNRRYRENMEKIKSGDLLQVASVIKSLLLRERERGLSTGERKMLHSAKQIFLSELVLSLGIGYEEAEQSMDEALALDS
jgi:CarD family transcriptional regulator